MVDRSQFLSDVLVRKDRSSDISINEKICSCNSLPCRIYAQRERHISADATAKQLLRGIDLERATLDLLDLEELIGEYFVDGVLPITLVDRRSDVFQTETVHCLRLDSASVAIDIDRMKLPESTRLALEQRLLVCIFVEFFASDCMCR